MTTKIAWPWELPNSLDGIAVIADVFGATTNITSFLTRGVKNLFIVNESNVQKAKDEYENVLIIGESLRLPENFFDSSNAPSEIEKIDVKNKTILYMSNNGSKIIELAFKKKAKEVITVSFTNIATVGKYLSCVKENVYLIPAGDVECDSRKADEDLICIEALDKILKGKNVDLDKAQKNAQVYIKANYSAKKFDHASNFKIMFNLNSSKIMPVCKRNSQGFIKIEDLNKLK